MNLFINYWRPISIAPRDGTSILTNCGTVLCVDGKWRPCTLGSTLWVDYENPFTLTPSVWMPIPQFPTEHPEVDEGERAVKLAKGAPGLYRSLKMIVDMDNDAHPGLSTWRSCRVAADQQARDTLEQLKP